MYRVIRDNTDIESLEISLQIIFNNINVIASNNIINRNDFINKCKETILNYGFNLIESEPSNRVNSDSYYFRFKASDHKGDIIYFNVYFELRTSSHLSKLDALNKDYSSCSDPETKSKLKNDLDTAQSHHDNFLDMKKNQFHSDNYEELKDVIINDNDYDSGFIQFKKRLGDAMKILAKEYSNES